MGFRTAVTMLLVVFASGVLLSATSGPSQTATQLQTSTITTVVSITTITSSVSITSTGTVTLGLRAFPSSAPPGAQINITGIGFTANHSVTIMFGNVATFYIVTKSDGTFDAPFTIPSNLTPGNYIITAEDVSGRSPSVTITVK